MPQCKAMSKRTKVRCGANAMTGKAVCYHHGGRSKGPPKGAQNAIKHGIHSKFFSSEEKDFVSGQEEKKLTDELSLNNAKLHRAQKYFATLEEGSEEYWRTFEVIERFNARNVRIKTAIIEQSNLVGSEQNSPLPLSM